MEARLTVVMCVTLVVASSMLHASLAQTTHVVGDGMGWIVPPGGEMAYTSWAASQTFTAGDILVFNYATGVHDVAEVSRESYDSCNFANPISLFTNGPTNITLTAGEHHYICTFGRHCNLGQRMTINVSSTATTPSPQPLTPPPAATPLPTTPPPTATPSPRPSKVPTTHIVGDSLGWTVPTGGPVAYQNWARGRNFMVGDTLEFNFATGAHDVLEVTRAEYNSCNATSNTTVIITGPARITLTSAGEHYYICTIPQHCSFGQQLAINVTYGRSTVSPAPTFGAPTMQPRIDPSTLPSDSATSFAVAALPVTLLVAAVAFLI